MKTIAKLFVVFFLVVVLVTPCSAGSKKHYWYNRSGNVLGLSDDLVYGDVGLVGLEEACVETFGRRARVCTSEEIIKAAPFSEPISDDGAWVYPTTVDATPDLIGGGWDMFDFSMTGASSLTNFSCRVWSTMEATGLIVYGYKEFRLDSCDIARAVVCCKAK
jgi:hypothetical protein